MRTTSSPRCCVSCRTANSTRRSLPIADIVVAGGSACESPENFQLVQAARRRARRRMGRLPAAGAKRLDPADRQIGQTGKTIRPKLYIAAGISGAIQHRVGVEGADMIVAINTDPNAPIFDFAHLGVVADAIELLPALTEAFRKRLSVNPDCAGYRRPP